MFVYGKEISWETFPEFQSFTETLFPYDRMKEINPLFIYEQEIPLDGIE